MEKPEFQEAMNSHFPEKDAAKGKSKRNGKAEKLTAARQEMNRGNRKERR